MLCVGAERSLPGGSSGAGGAALALGVSGQRPQAGGLLWAGLAMSLAQAARARCLERWPSCDFLIQLGPAESRGAGLERLKIASQPRGPGLSYS